MRGSQFARGNFYQAKGWCLFLTSSHLPPPHWLDINPTERYCFYIYKRLLTYFIKNPQDCRSQKCHLVQIRKRSPLGRDSPVDIWLDKQRNFCEKKVDWGSWLGEQSMGCVSAPLTSQQGALVQTTTHTPACGALEPQSFNWTFGYLIGDKFPSLCCN